MKGAYIVHMYTLREKTVNTLMSKNGKKLTYFDEIRFFQYIN